MGVGPNWQGLDKGFLAKGTAAYAIGQAVKQDTSEDQAVVALSAAAAANDNIYFVQEQIDAVKVATGKAFINCRMAGITRAIAGAANLAIGTKVTANASGQVIAATTGTPVIGRVVSKGGAVGTLLDVHITHAGVLA